MKSCGGKSTMPLCNLEIFTEYNLINDKQKRNKDP